MIKFEKIEFKNFLSYGNTPTTYEFKNGITYISGLNGQGKSVLADALCYVLFNSAYRDIKLAKLINLKNKCNLEVILYFSKNDNHYKVRRTMKTKGEADFFGIFELNSDGEWVIVPQLPHKKDYQKQFEENMIGMDKYYFEMIVIKSMLKPLSFVSLPKKDRMEFMDNIFSIHLFDFIAQENKDFLAELSQKRTLVNNSLTTQTKNLEMNKLLIEQSKKNLKDVIQKQYDEQQIELQNVEEELEKFEKAKVIINKFKNKLNDLNAQLTINNTEERNIDKEITKLESYLNISSEKYAKFRTSCGDCKTLKELESSDNIEEYTQRIQDLKNKKTVVDLEIEELETEIENTRTYTSRDSEISSTIYRLTNTRNNIEQKLMELHEQLVDEKVADDEILKKFELEIEDLNNQLISVDFEQRHEEVIKKLIQPLKFYIVKRWMPFFNKTLNEYLFKFGININIIFDEQFKETISFKNHAEIDYEALSNGQRKRVDLSIMLTLMELSKKIKNQSYNMLIVDEVCNGLDVDGISQFMEILKEKSDMEIIFISPIIEIDESVITRRFNVELVNGFSFIS